MILSLHYLTMKLKTMKKPNISQSLIKEFVKVQQGGCAAKFKAKYIDKNYPDQPSDAMKLGHYFEYMTTGALPKSGEIPEPKLLKSGKLSVPYARAEANAARCKAMLDKYGFEILEVGKGLKVVNGDGDNLTGVVDIIARRNGKLCVIDLKYSGLIGNKWEPLGWHPETLAHRFSHITQACHYTLLTEATYKEPVDFYFLILSPTNEVDGACFRLNITPERLAEHIELMNKVIFDLDVLELEPSPSFSNCKGCGMADTCPAYRGDLPDIVIIDADSYGGE